MPDFTELDDARAAVEQALRSTRWGYRTPPILSTPHSQHGPGYYDSECALCRGDAGAIAHMAVDAAYPHIAARVLRGLADDLMPTDPALAVACLQRATAYEEDAKDAATTDHDGETKP